MKRYFPNRLFYPALLGLLTACDPPVEVHFAQPFPAAAADLPGFAPGDCGRFVAADDSTRSVVVQPGLLLAQRLLADSVGLRQLDSLGLPRQAGIFRGHDSVLYRVQPLQASRFRLSQQWADTVLRLAAGSPARLRRYKGWYYLNLPTDTDAGQWEVQRLAVVGKQLYWQSFNPDTLRMQALEPGTVQVQRGQGRLHYTLQPHSARATRQVGRYAGLWLDGHDYRRQVPARPL
ncbi:MAG: hypothetical protein ACRYFX_04985 [Janthinobacterium lividum]